MNITKGDVQELRRRLKKTECTFGRLCGCYVNSGKQIVTKFTEQFSELEEDEYYKYLEIAKKTFSGTLGANLLELEFDRSDSGIEHQKYLLTLKDSKLANEELLDRLYEQVIEEYSYPGNYLIVVYHDVYDVPSKATSGEDQDESTELYAYCVCAVCPVELAKPALGYKEDENRIGARERDWVVGLPDLGFVYPAFAKPRQRCQRRDVLRQDRPSLASGVHRERARLCRAAHGCRGQAGIQERGARRLR